MGYSTKDQKNMRKIVFLAAAAGMAVAAPAAAQDEANNMGGFYVGAVAGLDHISLEDSTGTENDSGLLYGVTAGFDAVSGSAIFGLEAEVSDTTISSGAGDAGLDLYGGVRVGLKVDDNDLVYLKAGYTNVDVDLVDNLDGVRLGAGYERSFGNLYGRLEYRYSNYNISETLNADINGNRHQLLIGLGTKF